VRVGVYDRYWTTMGGGEQFAGGIVSALARRFEVSMIGPEVIDSEQLSERLSVDVSEASFTLVADSDAAVSRASADVDLFVNCTYLSPVVNLARHGLYVTHFPDEPVRPQVPWFRRLRDRGESHPTVPGESSVLGAGFYRDEGDLRWTDGGGHLDAPGSMQRLEFNITAEHCLSEKPWPVIIRVGRALVRFDDVRAGATIALDIADEHRVRGRIPISIQSPFFTPADAFGFGDGRQLGVQVSMLRMDGAPVSLIDASGLSASSPRRRIHLGSYDLLVSNSVFTQGWVRRLWETETGVLYPPVQLRTPAPKTSTIVSVGRFFANDRGHSKKQIEMIAAFQRLHRSGRADGWELHLIGGCSREDREYGLAARRAAVDGPVFIHFNATGTIVNELLGSASIYWHAAGLDEDPIAHPGRLEHFGIAIVEAMSAGAVPLVLNAGGPAEIVRDRIDGLHFSSSESLICHTASLISDAAWRTALSEAAIARSSEFGFDRFVVHLDALVDSLDYAR
jgi:glycosyltransferase involved in cell wall biosynthesis